MITPASAPTRPRTGRPDAIVEALTEDFGTRPRELSIYVSRPTLPQCLRRSRFRSSSYFVARSRPTAIECSAPRAKPTMLSRKP